METLGYSWYSTSLGYIGIVLCKDNVGKKKHI